MFLSTTGSSAYGIVESRDREPIRLRTSRTTTHDILDFEGEWDCK